jgi:hypothetical protein
MTLNKIRDAILRGWFGQTIWYRYIKPPGAYCKGCGRYYTYHQYALLPKEQIYPQCMATHTLCECGSHTWRFVG